MIIYITAIFLILVGFYTVFTRKNLLKILIGLSIADTGVNIFIISLGYRAGKTAPILSTKELLVEPVKKVVDPLPQALVLTAIVIGVAVTALALSIVIRMYNEKKSLDIRDYQELKW